MIVFTRAASSNTHLLSKAVRTTVTTLIPRDNLPNVSGSVAARLQQCPFMGATTVTTRFDTRGHNGVQHHGETHVYVTVVQTAHRLTRDRGMIGYHRHRQANGLYQVARRA